MAVIDTSMDMPKTCEECPYCDGDNATCDKGVLIPWRAFDVENYRNTNCPLKSTDEMIDEIEDTYIDNCDYNYQTAVDIIHKYCDKETKDENVQV